MTAIESIRPIQRSENAALNAVNLACPIEADFTFYFDRGEDFFALPDAIFDRHRYMGVFRRGQLVTYGMEGCSKGWVGDGWGDWFYAGDARTLPEARGQRLIRRLGIEFVRTMDDDLGLGLYLIKRGNEAAKRAVAGMEKEGFWLRPLCALHVANLLLVTPLGKPRTCTVRRAGPRDLPQMAELMRRAFAKRLYAPRITEESLRNEFETRPGLTIDRFYLAERDGRLVGLLGAWDMGQLKKTTILRYSPRGLLTAKVYGLARLVLRGAPPLPRAGKSFRSLYATRLAIPDRDPDVLRDLLRAVARDHRKAGYHLVHVGLCGNDPLLAALRRWPVQQFVSELHIVTRQSERWRSVLERSHDPYLDIAMI